MTPVTFMTCMSCMSCMHFMHVMHACHASLASVLNLGHAPPAQSVPWRRISDVFFHYNHPRVYNLGHVPHAQSVPWGRISVSIFEPGAKDLPPLEAILFNFLPPAVTVGQAHPYRQHQCFWALWRSIGRDSGAILLIFAFCGTFPCRKSTKKYGLKIVRS